MSWPLGIWVGRHFSKNKGGVPRVPLPRIIHDHINVDPQHLHKKLFRRYMFCTMAVGGYFFAKATISYDQ